MSALTPELRSVLEALERFASAVLRDHVYRAQGEVGPVADRAGELIEQCVNALASPAALPETRAHAPDCAISAAGARHGCTCGAEVDSSSTSAPGMVEITLNRKPRRVRGGGMKGGELRQALSVADDHDLWWLHPVNENDQLVDDAAVWVLRDGMHFYTAPQFINAGSAASGPGAEGVREAADNFEAALSRYADAVLAYERDDGDYEHLRGQRELRRAEVLRLHRAAPAPSPASADAELDTPTAALEDLLDAYRNALMDRVRGREDGGVTLRSEAYAERAAIHAHVAALVEAARGETGEVLATARLRHMAHGPDARLVAVSRAVLSNSNWFTDDAGVPVKIIRAASAPEEGR